MFKGIRVPKITNIIGNRGYLGATLYFLCSSKGTCGDITKLDGSKGCSGVVGLPAATSRLIIHYKTKK